MQFDAQSALDMYAPQKDGVLSSRFDAQSALDMYEPPREPGFVSKVLRSVFRGSVLEQMQTSYAILEGFDSGEIKQSDDVQETLQSMKSFVQKREKSIATEGILRQLEGPITLGVAAAGMAAPIKTAAAVGAFMGLDYVFNTREFIEEKFPNTDPNIKDIAEVADFLVKGAFIGAMEPRVRAGAKTFKNKSMYNLKRAKAARIEAKQVRGILESSQLTAAEKMKTLDILKIRGDRADLALKMEYGIRVASEDVASLVESGALWEKVAPELGIGEKPTTTKFKMYRGEDLTRAPNDYGVAGKGKYYAGRKQAAAAYGKPKPYDIEVKNPLRLTYKELGELQKKVVGKELTGFEELGSSQFHNYLLEKGYDSVILFDPEMSMKIPEEIVVLSKQPVPIASSELPVYEVKGTGKEKIRGLAKGVEQKAVAEGLSKGFGGLPEYKQVDMVEQSQLAVDLLKSNPSKARRIAMGMEAAPEGIIPEAVFVAVEQKAIVQRDVGTLKDLATASRLTTEATTMGQRIRTLGERDPESPTAAIKTIKEAREKKFAKRKTQKTVAKEKDKIKKAIKSEKIKDSEWTSFLKELEC